MSTEIDRAFAARCAAASGRLHQIAELSARPETDDAAVDRAAALAAELLADPEALLAVALVIEQQRLPAWVIAASVGDPPAPPADGAPA